MQSVTLIQPISSRVLLVKLKSNPNITIIAAYAPTEDASEQEKDIFYAELERANSYASPHDLLLVGGDFNARVGQDSHEISPRVVGKHGFHDISNANGERLRDFCEAAHLHISSTRFPHPKKRLWTWTHPTGVKAHLDHILCSRKWHNSVRNCRSYDSVNLDSDHRIISANIAISLRVPRKNGPRIQRPDWNKLSSDPVLQQQYLVEVSNLFQALSNDSASTHNETDGVQAQYDSFVSVLEKAAHCVPEQSRERRRPWVSTNTLEIKANRDNAKSRYTSTNSVIDKAKWQTLSRATDEAYRTDKVNFISNICTEATAAAERGNTKALFKLANSLSGKRRSSPIEQVRRSDGSPFENRTEALEEWASYFGKLLNNPPLTASETLLSVNISDPLPMRLDDIALSELLTALGESQSGKSPGIDSPVCIEALKYAGDAALTHLLSIFNKAWNSSCAPKQWRENIIIPIFKKGNRSSMNNYRGITLMSVAAKLYNRIILNRLYPHVNPLLRLNEAGFRRGMSCADQIHIIRRIIEGTKDKNLPLITTFVDFSKAFDSIDRPAMWHILSCYGVPEKVVQAIQSLYTNSVSSVRIGQERSKSFPVTTGVLQGDTLAPFLFIIVLDFVLRQTPNSLGFRPYGDLNSILTDLDFADDIVLLDKTKQAAVDHLVFLRNEALKVGLCINMDKTKTMAFSSPPEDIILPSGEKIEHVQDFKYLGAKVSSSSTDVLARKALAWGAFWNLTSVWRATDLPLLLKLRLFQSLCLSIFLYGCESWVITKALIKTINSFATSCYRYILGHKRTDHVPNKTILEEASAAPLVILVQTRQLKWLGHTLRKDGATPVSQFALFAPPHGKRKRGRFLLPPELH